VLDVKVLPQGPLWSDKANLDLGLHQALACVQKHPTGHGGVVGAGDGLVQNLEDGVHRCDGKLFIPHLYSLFTIGNMEMFIVQKPTNTCL
jgi:hypothetical protein